MKNKIALVDVEKAREAVKQDGVYNFGLGQEIVIRSPPDELTIKIAKALDDAAKIREESFDIKGAALAAKESEYVYFETFYTKDLGQASYESCRRNGLNRNLWYLVYLSLKNNWNDILDWAKEMQIKSNAA